MAKNKYVDPSYVKLLNLDDGQYLAKPTSRGWILHKKITQLIDGEVISVKKHSIKDVINIESVIS